MQRTPTRVTTTRAGVTDRSPAWRHLLIVATAVVLGTAAFLIQQQSLERYDLDLAIPEWLWVQLAVGLAFLVSGIVSDRAGTDSHAGGWMAAFGLIWVGRLVFVGPRFQWEDIGSSVALYGVLVVMLYAFPTGRLERWERWAAGSYLLLVTVLAVWAVAHFDYYAWVDDPRCCPSHALLIEHDPMLVDRITSVGGLIGAVVFTAVVLTLFRRWRRATAIGRRSLTTLGLVLVPLTVLVVVAPVLDALLEGPRFVGLVPSEGRMELYLQNGALALLPAVMTFELFRTRLARARVADMVRDLGRSAAPHEVEEALRAALADPRARLVFTRDEGGRVDVDGDPVELPPSLGITEIDDRSAIFHDPALDHDLVEAVGSAAALAIDNVRLQAELRAQLREVRASRRRLIRATDEARHRVERDLHDGAQQRLVALTAALRRAVRGVEGGSHDDLLADAAREAEIALGELRELAHGVHPAILTQAGLRAAVESLGDRAVIPVTVDIEPRRHSPEVESTAYFVISEALANASKHAEASEADVRVVMEGDQLVVTVRDDGRGGADPEGSGLRGLADRVGALGGEFEVVSGPGAGTAVTARLPIEGDE